jgi:hypothetical protein
MELARCRSVSLADQRKLAFLLFPDTSFSPLPLLRFDSESFPFEFGDVFWEKRRRGGCDLRALFVILPARAE